MAYKNNIEKQTGENCWIDLDGIESDAQFANVIIKAINQAKVFYLCILQNILKLKTMKAIGQYVR